MEKVLRNDQTVGCPKTVKRRRKHEEADEEDIYREESGHNIESNLGNDKESLEISHTRYIRWTLGLTP